MRILIIGGTRRCGPYLVEQLVNKGHSVICFHRGPSLVTVFWRTDILSVEIKARSCYL